MWGESLESHVSERYGWVYDRVLCDLYSSCAHKGGGASSTFYPADGFSLQRTYSLVRHDSSMKTPITHAMLRRMTWLRQVTAVRGFASKAAAFEGVPGVAATVPMYCDPFLWGGD